MTYQVKQAPYEDKLIEIAVRTGRPLPTAILNEPELEAWLRVHMQCYLELRVGLPNEQRIPWRDVQYWCDTYRLDEQTARVAHKAVQHMDTVWATLIPKRKQ